MPSVAVVACPALTRPQALSAIQSRPEPDAGFDVIGFLIGYTTGLPIGPGGITGAAIIGSMLHTTDTSPARADDTPPPAPSYTPDPSPSSDSGSSYSSGSDSSSSSDSGGSSGGGSSE